MNSPADREAEAAMKAYRDSQALLGRVPGLKRLTFLFLLMLCFTIFQTFTNQKIIEAWGGQPGVGLWDIVQWLLGGVAVLLLLTTRSIQVVKVILSGMLIIMAFWIIRDVVALSIISVAIDGVIFWYIYQVYDEIKHFWKIPTNRGHL